MVTTAIDTCIENILFAIGVTMFTIVSVICHLMDILGAWITELFRAFLDSKFAIRCILMVAMVIMLIVHTRPRYADYVHRYMGPTDLIMGNLLYVLAMIMWLYHLILLVNLIACPLCFCLGGLGEFISSLCGGGTGATGGGMPTPPSGNGLLGVAGASVAHIDPSENAGNGVNPIPEAPAMLDNYHRVADRPLSNHTSRSSGASSYIPIPIPFVADLSSLEGSSSGASSSTGTSLTTVPGTEIRSVLRTTTSTVNAPVTSSAIPLAGMRIIMSAPAMDRTTCTTAPRTALTTTRPANVMCMGTGAMVMTTVLTCLALTIATSLSVATTSKVIVQK